MLNDKAKITLELDVEGAKKQLADMKGELNNTSNLTKQKIIDTKDDIKKEETKETDRQKSLLPNRLNQIRQTFFDPNTPAKLAGGIVGLGFPQLAGPTTTYFQNSDNVKLLILFTENVLKNLPVIGKGAGAFGAALRQAEKVLPTDTIRGVKAGWEALSKTAEDSMSAYAGVFTGGHKPDMGAVGTHISRLYEYNRGMAMLDKNRRFMATEVLGKNLIEALAKAMKGRQ